MHNPKEVAGRKAAEFVRDGMSLGLGTGSTVYFTLMAIASRITAEGLAVRGVATSKDTETKARAMGIELVTLDEVETLDLTIDGADEIDGDFNMIKGGGGALLREKVVASISRQEIIVVGADKIVARLGSTFPVPVEVVPFARHAVERSLAQLPCRPSLRMVGGAPYVTDNGNVILDCTFAHGVADAASLEQRIDRIAGVVESGIFIGLAHTLVVGHVDGRCEVRHKNP